MAVEYLFINYKEWKGHDVEIRTNPLITELLAPGTLLRTHTHTHTHTHI